MVVHKMSGRQNRQGAGENPRSNKQTGRTQKENKEVTRGPQRQSGEEETRGRGLNTRGNKTQVKDIRLISEGEKKKHGGSKLGDDTREDETIKVKQDVHTT